MAAVDRFALTLTGRGAHGAQPHKGIDPVVVQAALVQSLQALVSRTLDPFTPAVLSVTHVEAGNTWNVIPQSAYLEGTVRTLSAQARRLLETGLGAAWPWKCPRRTAHRPRWNGFKVRLR